MKKIILILMVGLIYYLPAWAQPYTINSVSIPNGGSFTSVVEFKQTLYTTTPEGNVFISNDFGASWVEDNRFTLEFESDWQIAIELQQFNRFYTIENPNLLIFSGTSGTVVYDGNKFFEPEEVPEFFGNKGFFGDIVSVDTAIVASYRYSTGLGEIIISKDSARTWTSIANPNALLHTMVPFSGGLIGIEGGINGFSAKKMMRFDASLTSFERVDFPTEIIDRMLDLVELQDGSWLVSSFSQGIARSTDTAQTWTSVSESVVHKFLELSENLILGSTIDGKIIQSTDQGETWSELANFGKATSAFTSYVVSDFLMASNGTLLGAIRYGDAINYRFALPSEGMLSSKDNGATWSTSNDGLQAVNLTQMVSDQGTLYLSFPGFGFFEWDEKEDVLSSVGNEEGPDLSPLGTFVAIPSGWAGVGAVRMAKEPTTDTWKGLMSDVILTLNPTSGEWEYEELIPDNFTYVLIKYFDYLSNGMGVVHEGLGAFQGIWTSTDGTEWLKQENSPSGFSIEKFQSDEGIFVHLDTYGFSETIGVNVSVDTGKTYTTLEHEGLSFSYVTASAMHLNPVSDVIAIGFSYATPGSTLVELYDIESEASTALNLNVEEDARDSSVLDIIQTNSGITVALISSMDPTTFVSSPIGYHYYDSQASIWKPMQIANMPLTKASEIIPRGENGLVFRYGNKVYDVTFDDGLGTSNESELTAQPSTFALESNYPNPFNPTTQLRFTLSQASETQITVYSILGQKVTEMQLGKLSTGLHEVPFDAKGLSSGVYLYTIQAQGQQLTGKMTLMK